MLPAPHRLRTSADFTATVRGAGGVRVGSRLLVVHANHADARVGQPPRVGFVVSKATGNSVIRHRTTRRLRALLAARLSGIPTGVDVVVRAGGEAGSATSNDLAGALDPLLERALRRLAVS